MVLLLLLLMYTEDAGLVIISRVQKIKVCCCFTMGRLMEGTDP